jgi:hypothetical protein
LDGDVAYLSVVPTISPGSEFRIPSHSRLRFAPRDSI